MFAEHQPQLSKLGRSGPEGFKRIVTFTLCTIRVQLHAAVKDYILVRRGNRKVRSIFGSKHSGLDALDEHAGDYYEQCERAYYDYEGEELEDELLHVITAIPGIGAAKGGFIAQMIYGVSGCLDGHNLRRFGIPEGTYKLAGRPPTKRSALISDYNRVCRNVGGTQWLWDTWCQYLADRDANYTSAEAVSKLHLTPLLA